MIDLDQRYTISLEFSCGCREEWTVGLPPDPEEVVRVSPEVCTDHCPSCEATGRLCAMRESLVRYRPAEFTEIVPVKRAVRRKAS